MITPSHPLISIVVPTYNRAHLIGKTIESVLAQGFSEFELIIVDDGSTDNTSVVIDRYSDNRIRYYKKTNEERAAARNYGIKRALGTYVTFLDSDDLFYPNHLEMASIEITHQSPIFWQPYDEIDQAGNLSKPYRDSGTSIAHDLVHKGNLLSCHGIFIRRDLLIEQQFNEDRALSGSEDIELWLRLAARYDIKRLNTVSNALIHHDARSVFNFDNFQQLVNRKELMLQYLEQDQEVMKRFGKHFNIIQSRAYSYIALHGLLNHSNPVRPAWNYYRKSLVKDPKSIFSRRSISIIRAYIKRLF